MNEPIKIVQKCPLYFKNIVVSLYLNENDELMFQGCNNYHNCKACQMCRESSLPKALKYIKDEASNAANIHHL